MCLIPSGGNAGPVHVLRVGGDKLIEFPSSFIAKDPALTYVTASDPMEVMIIKADGKNLLQLKYPMDTTANTAVSTAWIVDYGWTGNAWTAESANLGEIANTTAISKIKQIFKLDKVLDDSSNFPGAAIEFLVWESAKGGEFLYDADLSLTTADGKQFTCDYGEIWPITEYPDDIDVNDMDGGTLISMRFGRGHGELESIILAWFDGNTLDFVKWPFSDFGQYNHRQITATGFENEPRPLFDFKWTGEDTFDLTCNLGGETEHFKVNAIMYQEITGNDFSNFDKAANPPQIKEFFVTKPSEDGRLTVVARVTYGEFSIICVDVGVTLKFDPDSCSLKFDAVNYTDDQTGYSPNVSKIIQGPIARYYMD